MSQHTFFAAATLVAATNGSAFQFPPHMDGAVGCRITMQTASLSAAGSLTAVIQGYDDVFDNFYDIPGATMTTAVATTLSISIYPGVAETAGQSVSDIVASIMRATVTPSSTLTAVTVNMGIDVFF